MGRSKQTLNMESIVEAKAMYTMQLKSLIKHPMYERLYDLFAQSVAHSADASQDQGLRWPEGPQDQDDSAGYPLVRFQQKLQEVPKWNTDVIQEMTQLIVPMCDHFNELITAVFLSNVRILTSVRTSSSSSKSQKRPKIQVTIPTNESFVHKAFVKVARAVYNDPYLMYDIHNTESSNPVSRHIGEVYSIIDTAIDDTIRDLLPIGDIVRTYVGDMSDSRSDDEEENEEDEDEDVDEETEQSGAAEPFEEEDPFEENVDNGAEAGDPFVDEPAPALAPHVEEAEEAEEAPSAGPDDFFSPPSSEVKVLPLAGPPQKGPPQAPQVPPQVPQAAQVPSQVPQVPQAPQAPQLRPPARFFDDVEDEE